MKAIIVDDSPQARKLLRLMVQELAPEISIIAECGTANEALPQILNIKPEILFLDIEMPGKTGLELAYEINQKNIDCAIIFTTAYNQYAINAFRLAALDYLLKPIQEDHLLEAINKAKERNSLEETRLKLEAFSKNNKNEQAEVLCVPVQSGFEYIPLKEILYLEADGSYVHIICSNEKPKLVAKNLKYFENVLVDCPNFVRTHRSFLVNMTEVVAYTKANGGGLVLNSTKVIPISRERKTIVLKYLENKS
jgi:two-component system LytT family response regulator